MKKVNDPIVKITPEMTIDEIKKAKKTLSKAYHRMNSGLPSMDQTIATLVAGGNYSIIEAARAAKKIAFFSAMTLEELYDESIELMDEIERQKNEGPKAED